MSNQLDITMDQGSTLVYTFNLKNADGTSFNLTAFEPRLQVRKTYGASKVEVDAKLGEGLAVVGDPANGVLKLELDPIKTAGITFTNKDDESLEAVYDLEIQSESGRVYKPARGTFTLTREVTR